MPVKRSTLRSGREATSSRKKSHWGCGLKKSQCWTENKDAWSWIAVKQTSAAWWAPVGFLASLAAMAQSRQTLAVEAEFSPWPFFDPI